MTEFLSNDAYKQAQEKMEKMKFSDAMDLLLNLANNNRINKVQFNTLKNLLVSNSYRNKDLQVQEDIITEMSIRDIQQRIKEILKLKEVEKYKLDEFTYENIPFEIFQVNGLLPNHLKQYKQSSEIVTYDLGININPIKKNVDVFLQKSGIFDN